MKVIGYVVLLIIAFILDLGVAFVLLYVDEYFSVSGWKYDNLAHPRLPQLSDTGDISEDKKEQFVSQVIIPISLYYQLVEEIDKKQSRSVDGGLVAVSWALFELCSGGLFTLLFGKIFESFSSSLFWFIISFLLGVTLCIICLRIVKPLYRKSTFQLEQFDDESIKSSTSAEIKSLISEYQLSYEKADRYYELLARLDYLKRNKKAIYLRSYLCKILFIVLFLITAVISIFISLE